jgi:hypothetical protein
VRAVQTQTQTGVQDMRLEKFKAIQISKLAQLKQQHADNARIAEIIDLYLMPKLQHLRQMDLSDYIFTLYLASREYAVFEELIPSVEDVDKIIREKNKLYYFKAKYIARLMHLRKELKQKYPNKADRVEEIVFEIAPKLANLRRYMLTDYLFTVTLACREFKELCNLMPSEEEVKKIFESQLEE